MNQKVLLIGIISYTGETGGIRIGSTIPDSSPISNRS
jgi:hypothetical protein